MSRDRPRSEYRDEEDLADDRTRDGRETDGRSWGPGMVPFGWPSFSGLGGTGATYGEDRYDERLHDDDRAEYDRDADDGTWLDEGLITLLLVAGVALFLFPEPATSGLGILLIGVGVLAWIVDLLV